MNDYYSARIDFSPCSEVITDLAASFLADAGFESFEPDGRGLTAFIPALYGGAESIARKALEDFPIECEYSISEEFIEGQDWNEEWEKNYFKPIIIDGLCAVHSSFHTDVPPAPYDIVIDPKMAFGTGHHDTTSNMIRFILSLPLEGKTVIDMGTGTGILGILASMRGASEVTGIEIDEAAYENAVENAGLNKTCMNLIHGDASALDSIPQADFLFANINRNIIIQDLKAYASSLKPSGIMLLSGFYEEDIPMILEEAGKFGLALSDSIVSNKWTALKLTKKLSEK